MKTSFLYLISIVALFSTVGCTEHTNATTQKPVRWQYHIERVENFVHKESSKLVTSGEFSKAGGLKKSNELEQAHGAFIFEDKIDELGKDGWELVGSYVEPETVWPDVGSDYEKPVKMPNMRGGELVLIFKRPL